MLSGFATVTYTVIPANSTQTATVALTGAQIADLVMLGMPSTLTTGLMFDGRVLASGSIGLRAANVTAASIAAFSVTAHFGVMGVTP
jgi:hypothetical protein